MTVKEQYCDIYVLALVYQVGKETETAIIFHRLWPEMETSGSNFKRKINQ
jgi:hypothetical protein